MASEDYRNDFPEEAVISVFLGKDPESNEVLGPNIRRVTKRELSLDNQIQTIKNGVGEIFQKGKDNDRMLTDIERDVAPLLEKVKRYLEGVK